MSLGTGRPMVLRDDSTIKHSRLLLSHSMNSPTDIRLVAQVQLVAKKSMCPSAYLIRIELYIHL